jgi:hypothetical protein
MATVGLRALAVIVIAVVRKRDTASRLTGRRVPATSDIGVRAKTTTREETVAAERVLVGAGDGLNLGALGVEEHVAVEVA